MLMMNLKENLLVKIPRLWLKIQSMKFQSTQLKRMFRISTTWCCAKLDEQESIKLGTENKFCSLFSNPKYSLPDTSMYNEVLFSDLGSNHDIYEKTQDKKEQVVPTILWYHQVYFVIMMHSLSTSKSISKPLAKSYSVPLTAVAVQPVPDPDTCSLQTSALVMGTGCQAELLALQLDNRTKDGGRRAG
eukprot:GFUD01121560.1.p1 GENE.GFUD01121560.1~~GFUD01121560.1.p1  ORF type:complete len:188 (+),score=26.30 GFUD01121560.1:335-898(+)